MIAHRFAALLVVLQLSNLVTPASHAKRVRSGGPDACPILTLAERGMPLPGGGPLTISTSLPGIINQQREVVFFSEVDGDVRNQGVFVVGPRGLREIVRGCGDGGGQGAGGSCGDPTPIGGTFGGFFDLSTLGPKINDAGDVLFLADVSNGSAPRGLFLVRGTDAALVKVAAIGDPSPLGGTIEALGNGVLGDQGQVAFLAWDVGSDPFADAYLALWDDGELEKVVTPGDLTPGGDVVQGVSLLNLSYPDGTSMPVVPFPSFDEAGRLAVWVGATNSGVLLFEEGASSWLVRNGDPAPGGGAFSSVFSPMVRNGRATFTASQPDGALIGSPGDWQAFWLEGQTLDGMLVDRIEVEEGRHILDDAGQVTLSMRVQVGTSFRTLVARWNERDGVFPLVTPSSPAPGGGTILGASAGVSVNRRGDVTFNLLIDRSDSLVRGIYRVDNCQFGVVFDDGFESGNTDAWSSSQP